MMGQQARAESLFYYFRLEDQIPRDHLLWLIDHHVDLNFVRGRLWGSVCAGSETRVTAWTVGNSLNCGNIATEPGQPASLGWFAH
jgi:hypothetical protein